MGVCAIVVTFNRRELLLRALDALAKQTRKPDRILVVDNASTDGTIEVLEERGWSRRKDVQIVPLPFNSGGAGGFRRGLELASKGGWDWFWLMDDDALPALDALEKLMEHVDGPDDLYGSIAVHGEQLAWRLHRLDTAGGAKAVDAPGQLPLRCRVSFLPFLGLLVHARTLKAIGLPEGDFFLAADDVEFCLRARRAGRQVFAVRDSRVEHPKANARYITLFGAQIQHLILPPWKRYYDVRNRLVVAKRHHGSALYYLALPSTLFRFLLSMAREPNRSGQARAYWAGLIDGLLGKLGARHEIWRLGPPGGHQAPPQKAQSDR